ncbi:hypothetical protein [Leptospira licerasiae]|nr:hypothetical protein [Leptospira licerasiae]
MKLAICTPLRTPFAQIAKGLGAYPAHHLGKIVAESNASIRQSAK